MMKHFPHNYAFYIKLSDMQTGESGFFPNVHPKKFAKIQKITQK